MPGSIQDEGIEDGCECGSCGSRSEVVALELGRCLLWEERATTVCPRAQKTSLTHLYYVILLSDLKEKRDNTTLEIIAYEINPRNNKISVFVPRTSKYAPSPKTSSADPQSSHAYTP